MSTPSTRVVDSATNLVDSAAQSADHAIRASQRVANDTMDQLADGVDEARAKTGPMLDRLVSDAERLTRRGVAAVRDTSQQLRETTQRASETTVGYIKDEPIKSVLIAAAVGAALMALVSLASRSRN